MLKDYISNIEFVKYSGCVPSAVYSIKFIERLNIGGLGFIKKSSLPEKYRYIISKCVDLTLYLPVTHFLKIVSLNRCYISVKIIQNNSKFEILTLGKGRGHLFKVTDEFIKLLHDGKTFVALDGRYNNDESFYEGVIVVNGIKLGWY